MRSLVLPVLKCAPPPYTRSVIQCPLPMAPPTSPLIQVLLLYDLYCKKYRFVILKYFPGNRLVKKAMG